MKIAVITTGGTIDKGYFDALSEYQVVDSLLPEILDSFGLGLDLEYFPVCRKDSLELNGDDRAKIVATINRLPHDKILITHGTDTMVDTAQYIGKMEHKTIVLTGAMKPARFKDTDAVFNVGVAMGALQSKAHGVYIAMSGQVFRPENVKKNREQQRFESS